MQPIIAHSPVSPRAEAGTVLLSGRRTARKGLAEFLVVSVTGLLEALCNLLGFGQLTLIGQRQ